MPQKAKTVALKQVTLARPTPEPGHYVFTKTNAAHSSVQSASIPQDQRFPGLILP